MEKVLFIITASALCAISSLAERRYQFIYELKNWIEAQNYCRANYADLVTVRSMEDVEILNSMADSDKIPSEASNYAWIGLYDDLNSWRWSKMDRDSHKPEAEFRNWKVGQPDNVDGGENCVVMAYTGNWNDMDCKSIHTLICSNVEGQNEAFVHINKGMSWTEAQSYCRVHHADLATVRNEEDNQQIKGMITGNNAAWIGLFRDPWKWSDGHNSTISYWGEGQPHGQGEACAGADFGKSGKWGDGFCSRELPFICYDDRVPVSKQVFKLRLLSSSSVDLNDPAVLDDLMKTLKQKLKEKGVDGDIKLTWRKQEDGNIFLREEKED